MRVAQQRGKKEGRWFTAKESGKKRRAWEATLTASRETHTTSISEGKEEGLKSDSEMNKKGRMIS